MNSELRIVSSQVWRQPTISCATGFSIVTGASDSGLDRAGFWMYVVGGLGFAVSFLAAGAVSVPRRWAVHDASWMAYDRLGVLFAVLVVVGAIAFVGYIPKRTEK